MKKRILHEHLQKFTRGPIYQCPHCEAIWLIIGGQQLLNYACKSCGEHFIPAQTRYRRNGNLSQIPASQLKTA